jgi:hypothetical protein
MILGEKFFIGSRALPAQSGSVAWPAPKNHYLRYRYAKPASAQDIKENRC